MMAGDRRGALIRTVAVTALCSPLVAHGAEAPPAGPGRLAFLQNCAACHGPEGGGFTAPPVIGPEAALAVYRNADRLLNYISTTMPQDRPGALDEGTYREVLTFLLKQNGYVAEDWNWDSSELDSIPLTNGR